MDLGFRPPVHRASSLNLLPGRAPHPLRADWPHSSAPSTHGSIGRPSLTWVGVKGGRCHHGPSPGLAAGLASAHATADPGEPAVHRARTLTVPGQWDLPGDGLSATHQDPGGAGSGLGAAAAHLRKTFWNIPPPPCSKNRGFPTPEHRCLAQGWLSLSLSRPPPGRTRRPAGRRGQAGQLGEAAKHG